MDRGSTPLRFSFSTKVVRFRWSNCAAREVTPLALRKASMMRCFSYCSTSLERLMPSSLNRMNCSLSSGSDDLLTDFLGEISDTKDSVLLEHDQPLDHVLQLSNVAGPVVLGQQLEGVGSKA